MAAGAGAGRSMGTRAPPSHALTAGGDVASFVVLSPGAHSPHTPQARAVVPLLQVSDPWAEGMLGAFCGGRVCDVLWGQHL